jgi:hypothetical protein
MGYQCSSERSGRRGNRAGGRLSVRAGAHQLDVDHVSRGGTKRRSARDARGRGIEPAGLARGRRVRPGAALATAAPERIRRRQGSSARTRALERLTCADRAADAPGFVVHSLSGDGVDTRPDETEHCEEKHDARRRPRRG